MSSITLIPAYGRDYKSAKEVRKAWHANKDFVIASITHPDNGRYINREQTKKGETYCIRYRKLERIAAVKGDPAG